MDFPIKYGGFPYINVPLHQSIDIISGHFRNRFIGGTYHDGRMGANHEEMMNDIVCH